MAVTYTSPDSLPKYDNASAADFGVQTAAMMDAAQAALTARFGKLPAAMAQGVQSVTISAAVTGTAAVTFPAGRFSAAPAVTAVAANSNYTAFVSSVTASGFTCGARRADGTTVTATLDVHWIAAGA